VFSGYRHFDRDDTADVLKQVYTVILYLTDGVDSTAFPQFPLDEFAVPEFDTGEEVLNTAALRATVERGCLNKERYDRWPVRVGDMAIFTQATMVCPTPAAFIAVCLERFDSDWCVCCDVCCLQHFGTKNNILHERMALFSVLTPFVGRRQDDYQIYRSAWKHLAGAAACVTCFILSCCY
jgi:hypothetical protein